MFPAGPPAAIMLYTLAPDLLLGWPRANRPEEREFLLPDIGARPEVGRITGRGNTANLEAVLALKPDLILDVGSTDATYVSLADRVQEQTGIPYALLDGRFDGDRRDLPHARATDRQRKARRRARRLHRAHASRPSPGASPASRRRSARASTMRAARAGSRPGSAARSMSRPSNCSRATSRAAPRAAWRGVSIEQVLVWNPGRHHHHRQGFRGTVRSDPVWAAVAAVRAGRVHLSPKLPFGWVDFPPSVNRLIGLWWLAKILYPELFPEDIRALTRDFYKRFYHVTPTPRRSTTCWKGEDDPLRGSGLCDRARRAGCRIAVRLLGRALSGRAWRSRRVRGRALERARRRRCRRRSRT